MRFFANIFIRLFKIYSIVLLLLLLNNLAYADSSELSSAEKNIINQIIKNSTGYELKEVSEREKIINDINLHRSKKLLNMMDNNKKSEDSNEDGVKESQIDGIDISVNNNANRENIGQLITDAYKAFNMKYYEIALTLYQKAKELDPEREDILFGIAASHHKLGHIEHAKQKYIKILELNPENKFALNNFLAILSYEKPEAALEVLAQLEVAVPDMDIIPAQIAIIHNRQHNYQEALKYFKKANKLNPRNLDYLYQIGVIFENLGNHNNAMILYSKITQAINAGYKSNVTYREVSTRLSLLSYLSYHKSSNPSYKEVLYQQNRD